MIQNLAPSSSTHGRHSVTTMRNSTSLPLPAAVVVDLVAAVVDVDVAAVVVVVEDAAQANSRMKLFGSHGISPMVSSGSSLRDLLERRLISGK